MASGHLDEAAYQSQVWAVWKSTILLSIVTAVEVAIALGHFYFFPESPRLLVNIMMVLATFLKAFFIVGEFMHLKYEQRAFIISLGVPLIFLVWAIIAFSIEGNYWLSMRPE